MQRNLFNLVVLAIICVLLGFLLRAVKNNLLQLEVCTIKVSKGLLTPHAA